MNAVLDRQGVDIRVASAAIAVPKVPNRERRLLPRHCGLVVAANRQHRMAIVRVDASGQYSVIRWSEGNGPLVGEQLLGDLESAGAGPLFDPASGTDVNVVVVAPRYALKEAIEAID